MDNVTAISDNPSALGFSWATEPVGRGTGVDRRTIGTAQILVVSDAAKFIASFPNGKAVVEGSLDGSSIRVISQGVNRPMIERDRKVTVAALRTAVIARLSGVRAKVVGGVAALSTDALEAELARRKAAPKA